MGKLKRKNVEFQYPDDTVYGSIERLRYATQELEDAIVQDVFNGNHPLHVFCFYLVRIINSLAKQIRKYRNGRFI